MDLSEGKDPEIFSTSDLCVLLALLPAQTQRQKAAAMSATLPVLLVLSSILSVALALNNSPIIGIFSQPSTSKLGKCNGDCLYIAASYVKYLEVQPH
jgi:hypothetical protein